MNVNIKYRDYLPQNKNKKIDLIIISLIHQSKDMLLYMIKNIQRYLIGNYMFFIHYNGTDFIDENNLPDWVWLNRNPIRTQRFTQTLSFAITDTIKFAVENIDFTNVMLMSSGSVFFRKWEIPKNEYIGILSNQKLFNFKNNVFHEEPVLIKYCGKVSEYLKEKGIGVWQYGFEGHGCDIDLGFHNLIKKRGFKYFKGCQWSGQIFPKNVCIQIAEDIPKLKNENIMFYACEEIYFSTYAYNYAIENNISINFTECNTNWEYYYEIKDINYIINTHYKHPNIGHALCKLPDDTNHPTRIFINSFYYEP